MPLTTARPCLATALTASSVYRLNFHDIERSPVIAVQLIPLLVASLKCKEEFLAVTNRRNIRERLDAFLSLLGRQAGRKTEAGLRVDFPLTHQQIANAICATRVSVTRLMVRYRELGLVGYDNQHLLIRKICLFCPEMCSPAHCTSARQLVR